MHIFLNQGGLRDALIRAGLADAGEAIGAFMLGFTQSSERFAVVDVGSGKEAADAKIKGEFLTHSF